MVDVNMSDATATNSNPNSTSPQSTDNSLAESLQLLNLLRHNLSLLERSVKHLEPRFTSRVLRTLTAARKRDERYPNVLARAIIEGTQPNDPVRNQLLSFLPQPFNPPNNNPSSTPNVSKVDSDSMQIDSAATPETKNAPESKAATENKSQADQPHVPVPDAEPELQAYLRLLVVILLVDSKKVEQALELSRLSIQSIAGQNRRSLDQLLARTIFYLGRCVELLKLKGQGQGLAGERSNLLALHTTSSLRHDPETTATVLNLLLRSYLVESNLYDQADKLVARAPFPRSHASNGQIARWEYYVGRIRAVQLNYTEAHTHLQQAIRRAPQPGQVRSSEKKAPVKSTVAENQKEGEARDGKDSSSKDSGEKKSENGPKNKPAAPEVPLEPLTSTPNEISDPTSTIASGFLSTAYKFLIVVELLMGEIPERGIFRKNNLKNQLSPYMEIVQAVRIGDLDLFSKTLNNYSKLFQEDKTYSLILRLRHNVIKTGIRMISLGYNRISLLDITKKLKLDSEEDSEYIVAKAIRDGVIDARVDHERGEMVSVEGKDIYATNEPQQQFRTRIGFCLQLHNDSVKAMRYPLNSHRAELESANEARERERELATEIADGEMDDDDEDWP